MARNIFKEIERRVMNEQMDETTRQKLLGNLLRMKEQKINLMITGATGVGKSSTINALFGEEVAKVGTSVNPETRLVYAQNINKEEAMWKDNDDLQDYRAGVLEKFVESVTKGMAIGGTIGQAIGSLVGLGSVGRVIGTVGGAIVGVGANIISGVFDFLGEIF